jgi:hypothetical protein
MAKMYVIGDSEAGVLFIKTNPVRLAMVPMANVLAYANAEPGDGAAIKQVLSKVAGAAKKSIIPADESDAEDAIGAITDAEFCFIADVEDSEWSSRRFRSVPVEQPLNVVGAADV